MVDALKVTKSRKRSKSDLASIDFDSIDVQDVKYLPSSFNGDVLFLLPLWHLKLQVRMAAQWTAWTRCATVTLGAPPKP
jgi:hypothetical protein